MPSSLSHPLPPSLLSINFTRCQSLHQCRPHALLAFLQSFHPCWHHVEQITVLLVRLNWWQKAAIPLSVTIIVAVVVITAIVSFTETCLFLGLLSGGDRVMLPWGTLGILGGVGVGLRRGR